jgi:hypothetical protein
MRLTLGQLARMRQLSDQWSFLWDKHRSLWIAAEDCPDGEQIEDADLDLLLAQLPSGLECLRAGEEPRPAHCPGGGSRGYLRHVRRSRMLWCHGVRASPQEQHSGAKQMSS